MSLKTRKRCKFEEPKAQKNRFSRVHEREKPRQKAKRESKKQQQGEGGGEEG